MKKVVNLIICMLIIFTLTGCTHKKVKRDTYIDAQNTIEFLVDAINKKDKTAIKNKFSKYAVKNIDDLDEKIDRLIDEFPEWNEEYEISDTFERWSNHGKITYMLTPSYDFSVDENKYCIRIIYYTKSDEDKSKLGWYSIQIFEKNNNYSDSFYMHGIDEDPDILLWDYTKD